MGKQKASKDPVASVEKEEKGTGQVFESLFGFKISDFTSMESLLRLLCRPTDPSGLGVMRMVFGNIL